MEVLDLLEAAYRPLIAFAADLDEERGWTPTALPGWAVRDLILHLATDAQRALVALATPVTGAPDTDAVSYWRHWAPGTEGAQAGLRGVRIMASAWSSVRGPAELYTETASAVLVAAAAADVDAVVQTQGHRLTVAALLRTLAVEAAIHQLDLTAAIVEPPAAPVLAEVRATLDGLLGRPVTVDWDDTTYALAGTGRRALTGSERERLGELAGRFPLFG